MPHRRLVLERRRAHAPAPCRARPSTTSSCRRATTSRLAVHGDGRGAAEARDRRLDDARGAARRGRGAAGARRRRSSRRCASRSPSSCPSTTGRRRTGDTLVVDLAEPRRRGAARHVVELGSGRLVEEIEAALIGASVGETKEVDVRARRRVERRGRRSRVKHVNEKVLPELDDELARSASEFDTLAELRADIEGRVRDASRRRSTPRFRAAAVDALVDGLERPGRRPARRDARTRELLNGFVRSLERRGIDARRPTSQLTGQSPELLDRQMQRRGGAVGRARARARGGRRQGGDRDLRRRGQGADPRAGRGVRRRPRAGDRGHLAHGHQESLREDLRLRAALDRLVADVKPIPLELAEARDKLWTPDKENPPSREEVVDPRQQGASDEPVDSRW